MNELPKPLRNHPPAQRYFQTWKNDEASIVFVPLAEILRERGFLAEAKDVCQRGLRHNLDSISGRLILASVYWAGGQKSEAAAVAAEILVRMPNHPEARKYITSDSPEPSEKQDPSERQDLRKTESTGSLWVTPTMAEILVGQGEYEEASRILSDLVKQQPKSRQLKRRLHEVEVLMEEEEKTVV